MSGSSLRDKLKNMLGGKDKKDFQKEVSQKRGTMSSADIAKLSSDEKRKSGGNLGALHSKISKIDQSDKDVEINDPKKMPQKLADLNKRFEKVLKYREIQPTDKRYKAMMSKPPDEKWKIILLHDKSVAEQENSAKIREAPEYFVHCLKEAPTRENLSELVKQLRGKAEEWVKRFLSLSGLSILFEVVAGSAESQSEEWSRKARDVPKMKKQEENENKDSEPEEQKSEPPKELPKEAAQPVNNDMFDLLQAEAMKAIRILMNTPAGMKAFMETKERCVRDLVRVLASENVRTKTQIFFLLSTISVLSEEGFWLTLDIINQLKSLKREAVRFTSIVESLASKTEGDVDSILFKISCMMFINAMITAPQDQSTKNQLKREMNDLKTLAIVEKLKKQNLDDKLMIQISVFEEEMDEADDEDLENDVENSMDNLENPMEILKLIRVQLSGSSAFEHFVNILQYFLIISGKSSDAEKSENMKILQEVIKKAIMTSEDGSVSQISVKELQLTDRVAGQQKKISDLEDKLGKLTTMMKSGKIDQKMLDTLAASVETSKKKMDMDDPEMSKAVLAETQAILNKSKLSVDVESLEPSEYKNHLKNLEAEVKFLTYKLKTAEKKVATSSGSAHGSAKAGSAPSMGSNAAASDNMGGPPPPPSTGMGGPPPPPPMGMGGPPPPPPMGMGGPPPPPPPMGMGGPPPPPPPMGMGGPPPPPPPMGMGGPPPPPPMGMGGPPPPMAANRFALPPLPMAKSSVPLRGIFWTNVPNQKLKESIWLKKGLVESLEKLNQDLDLKEIETLFAAKKTETGQGAVEVKQKAEKITLIDPKKANNSAIILGSMRMPNKEIRKAILAMDETKLAPENIKALKDMAPTPDEAAAVKDYSGDLNLLGSAEMFIREIQDIPRFDQRLTVWLFKQRFPQLISTIQPDIENLTAACKELQESEQFPKLLEIVLAIGNFLNSGRKGVHGFQLSSLVKLKDTKGAKTDLLEYIVGVIEKKYFEVFNFTEELSHIEPAQRVAVTNVQTELTELRNGLNLVSTEIELFTPADPSDQFRTTMIEFLDFASEKLDELESNFQELQEQIVKLSIFYGEDEKKFKVESFVNDINEFIKAFKFAFSELERKRDMERRKAEREKKKNLSSDQPQERVVKTVMKKSEDGGDGILDSTIDALAEGSGFKKSKNKKKLKGSALGVDDVLAHLNSKEAKPKKKKFEGEID